MMSTFRGMQKLELHAPAKINLHLRVGPRRGDGFHPLLSWMTTVGLFDTLSFTSPSTAELSEKSTAILMTCDDPSLPCDARNLVFKAADIFRKAMQDANPSKEVPSIAIHLRKRIPAGGGLGGGSSDATRTLVGLNRLWQCDKDTGWLSQLAAKLGSDVPFFLFGASSVCGGRGEDVHPIGLPGSGLGLKLAVTLILPPMAMPTADVYRRFDELGLGRGKDVEQEPRWSEWVSMDTHSLLPMLVNDLETPAFSLRPDLGNLRADIENTVHRPVRMSGSGSSLFTLFDEQKEAAAAAEKIMAVHGVRATAVALTPTDSD